MKTRKPRRKRVVDVPKIFADITIDDVPLARMRAARRLTQEELALALQTQQEVISRFENVTRLPTPQLASKMVEFFGEGWTGERRELLFLYPDRYRAVPLPFEVYTSAKRSQQEA